MTDRPALEDPDAVRARVRAALPPYDKPVYGDTGRGIQIGWDRARQAALDAIDGEPSVQAPGVREVRIVIQAPTDENAASWAATIRDLVVAEYGQEMRLDVTITPGGQA